MKYSILGRKSMTLLILVCFLLLPMVAGHVLAAPMRDNLTPSNAAKTITGKKAEELATKTMLSDDFKVISSQYTMDIANITVKQLNKAYSNRYAVGIPIKDNTGINISCFVGIFNSKGEFEGTQWMIYEKINDVTYHFTGNMNKVQVEMDVAENGELLDGYALYENGNRVDLKTVVSTKGFSEWWDCMGTCFGNIGVPGWVITVVGTACAGVCIVSVGTACFACFLASEFLVGFDVGACIAYCSGWAD